MRKAIAAGLAGLFVCALIAGCGGGGSSTTTTTSTGGNAQQSVDAAIRSCSNQAQRLSGFAGSELSTVCTSIGHTAKQAVSKSGKQLKQALSNAAHSCRDAVKQFPQTGGTGQARVELSKLCDAIASAK